VVDINNRATIVIIYFIRFGWAWSKILKS
jgi:hypothetical protein